MCQRHENMRMNFNTFFPSSYTFSQIIFLSPTDRKSWKTSSLSAAVLHLQFSTGKIAAWRIKLKWNAKAASVWLSSSDLRKLWILQTDCDMTIWLQWVRSHFSLFFISTISCIIGTIKTFRRGWDELRLNNDWKGLSQIENWMWSNLKLQLKGKWNQMGYESLIFYRWLGYNKNWWHGIGCGKKKKKKMLTFLFF